jgi:hypothetical protein
VRRHRLNYLLPVDAAVIDQVERAAEAQDAESH